ncbi:hypothetical protein D3C78_1635880 [compost metagenome]
MVQVEDQLPAIPVQLFSRLLQGEAHQRRQVVGDAFRRAETDGVPSGIADIGMLQGAAVAAAQQLVMFGAFAAVPVVGEMLRARTVAESGVYGSEYLGVGGHGRVAGPGIDGR